MVIREIDSRENFNGFLEMENDTIHVVKFGASWCGPCRVLSDTLKNLNTEKTHNTIFGTVEIEEDWSEDLSEELGIRNIPVLLYYKNGIEVKRTLGLQTAESIYKTIEELV